MMYRLHVTVNYKDHEWDAVHPDLTLDNLMLAFRNYAELKGWSSLVITVARGRGVSDVSITANGLAKT